MNEEHEIEPKIKNKSKKREIFEWIQAIAFALILAFLIRGFIFEQALVEGRSMENTLEDKQRLIVYKLGYHFHAPDRGDIIVLQYQEGLFKYLPFPDPKEIDYIKRVIGLPGDVINISEDGKVSVNNIQLKEPYIKGSTFPESMEFPVTIPADKVMVLGDNRENSSDSRQIGLIELSRIRGKAVFRIYPFKVFGSLYDSLEKSNLKEIGEK